MNRQTTAEGTETSWVGFSVGSYMLYDLDQCWSTCTCVVKAFLSLWYFKCHSLCFLSVSVNLIRVPGFPFVSIHGFFCFAVRSVWAPAHLTRLRMDPPEKNHLFCWIALQRYQLSDEVHCLVAQIPWLAERDLRWRSYSQHMKRCCCQTGNLCYCSALNCLFYTHCIWWTKDTACCPLPRAFSLAWCLLKGKESWFMLLRIMFHLLPWRTLGLFHSPLKWKMKWYSRNSSFLHLPLAMETSYKWWSSRGAAG